VEHREQRITVETARHRITGTLHLPRGGYRSRLTDFLNTSEQEFVALTDCEIGLLDGPMVAEREAFVAVARRHVVLAIPLDGGPD